MNNNVGEHNMKMVQALGWIFAFKIPSRFYKIIETTKSKRWVLNFTEGEKLVIFKIGSRWVCCDKCLWMRQNRVLKIVRFLKIFNRW